jgi:hypothetical protein
MAQGNRSSRPKTACCRCRRRAEGISRLTNLGWLCDSCYDLLNRTELGRRLYRLVFHVSGRPVDARPSRPAAAEAPVGRIAEEPEAAGVLVA